MLPSINCHDAKHYAPWRATRIDKLQQVLSSEFFRNKDVLEVGCGTGKVGQFLRESWGANVTFTEGRADLIPMIRANNPDADIHHIDHELPWDLDKKFDFIIHWGLLYHLGAWPWKWDLRCAARHLRPDGKLSLESEVLDSARDQQLLLKENPHGSDQSMSGNGARPSAIAVENVLDVWCNLKYVRYDDADLNSSFHCYDWVSGKTVGQLVVGQRRYWICSRD